MIKIKSQLGVGMIEVLVALVLLAIGVLGYVALQVRAVDASSEALNRSKAISFMRGLAENIRANTAAQDAYPAAVRSYTAFTATTAAPNPQCFNVTCTPEQLAKFDAYQAALSGFDLGMKITMDNCPGITTTSLIKRQCLFAAWGNTSLTATDVAADYSNCISSTTGIYNAGSTCLMIEVY
jgi:type IV pilus assembly protein PilV